MAPERRPLGRKPSSAPISPERARLIAAGRIIPANPAEAETAKQLLEALKRQATAQPDIRKKIDAPRAPVRGVRNYRTIPETHQIVPLGKNTFLTRLALPVNSYTGKGRENKPLFQGEQVSLDLLVEFTEADLESLGKPATQKRILHAQTADGKHLVKIVGQGKYDLLGRITKIRKGQAPSENWTWHPAFIEPPLE
ncbi:MAG: hypothetical protein PHD95_01320 [Candidatus ainarchaeum sp.]|nr:hypothetical protein [Candidatus ainarchaeum sp.]